MIKICILHQNFVHIQNFAPLQNFGHVKNYDHKYKGVPKLVLILSQLTCNAIYKNSNKVRVFCSSLSFQQTPTDVCMPSYNWFCENSCIYSFREQEVQEEADKKMGGAFNGREHEKCNRKVVRYVRNVNFFPFHIDTYRFEKIKLFNKIVKKFDKIKKLNN